MGAAAGDTDNDGDVDLYVTYWGENVLYESAGDGRFTDVTAAAGVGDPGWGTSAACSTRARPVTGASGPATPGPVGSLERGLEVLPAGAGGAPGPEAGHRPGGRGRSPFTGGRLPRARRRTATRSTAATSAASRPAPIPTRCSQAARGLGIPRGTGWRPPVTRRSSSPAPGWPRRPATAASTASSPSTPKGSAAARRTTWRPRGRSSIRHRRSASRPASAASTGWG